MRTTLELYDTVLAAARALARAEGTSIGAAVSELARRGLRGSANPADGRLTVDTSYSPFPIVIGEPDVIVTDQLVAAHRDD